MTENRQIVDDFLQRHAGENPERPALVDLATGRSFNYGDLNERATRLATGLRDQLEVTRGKRVALLARNSTDYFELMFACWKLGAIFVPLNWRLKPIEIGEILRHAAPDVVVADAEFGASVEDHSLPQLIRRPRQSDCAYEALIHSNQAAALMPALQPDDITMLLYTSGTTGCPKGVIYTWRMIHNVFIHAQIHAHIRADSRALVHVPLFHAAGLNGVAIPALFHGGCVYVMEHWNAAECLRYLTDANMSITHCLGVPTNYIMMSELPEFSAARFPTIEFLSVGSAPVPRELLDRWEEHGIALSQSYGMTEAFCVSLTPPEKARAQLGSAGEPLRYVEVRIAAADDVELPRGQVGEIQVRGPGVTPGYWQDPVLTAAAFTTDGWFHTGDAAKMTVENVIYVADRIKDMFISGGENVYPAEVEDVIAAFPEVSLVSVIGIPDAKWGETGLALIVVRAGASITAEQITSRCRERLAHFKVPQQVRFVPSLPLSPQGKILKRELREIYKDQAAATA